MSHACLLWQIESDQMWCVNSQLDHTSYRSHGDLLDSMVSPLERMRRELRDLVNLTKEVTHTYTVFNTHIHTCSLTTDHSLSLPRPLSLPYILITTHTHTHTQCLNYVHNTNHDWLWQAMIHTGAPTKLKRDDLCPFFYQTNSWSKQQRIPWSDSGKRYLRPGQDA